MVGTDCLFTIYEHTSTRTLTHTHMQIYTSDTRHWAWTLGGLSDQLSLQSHGLGTIVLLILQMRRLRLEELNSLSKMVRFAL